MQSQVPYEKYLQHMLRFKQGLQSFGKDYGYNLDLLLALCKDLLEADFVLYNVLIDGKLHCRGELNAPMDMKHDSHSDRHLCNDAIHFHQNKPYVVSDLQSSKYAQTSLCISKYGLQSYIGHPVYLEHKPYGVLCAFFSSGTSFSEESVSFMEIVANLISAEEERHRTDIVQLQTDSDFHKLYQMLRLMCDNSPDMIWAKDTQNRYLFTNETFCRKVLIADDTDEPIGKTDMFFAQRQRDLHPDNPNWHTFGEICRDSDTIVMESLQPHRFDEYGNILGEFLRLDVRKAPFWDHEGNLIGTVGSARDVTMDREIEDTIRDSRERYQAILEANPDLMFLYDEDGVYLDYRVIDKSMMVADPEEMLGKSVYDLLPKHLAEKAIEAIHHVRDTGETYFQEYDLDLDRKRYFESRFVPCGKGRYLSIIRDITDRKLADIRHQEIEKKYRRIFETANEGILAMDQNHVIVETNQRFCDMLGYLPEDLIGNTPTVFLFDDDLPDHNKRLEARKQGRNDVYERRSRKKDGSALWTLISATAILDDDGNFAGSFAMMQDISEGKSMEIRLTNSIARNALQRNCMTYISVSSMVPNGEVEAIVAEITTMAAKTMEV
ncbi:MAG: PAS domain S-box protein, partial [Candidatus Cloacimonadaceae bacterium]|nr:PAS domain S-box protein [Candidatus Cloacimonadaceae bacterium]